MNLSPAEELGSPTSIASHVVEAVVPVLIAALHQTNGLYSTATPE